MAKDDGATVVFVSFLIVGCSLFSCIIGGYTGRDWLRENAIKKGVAEWTVDSKTGETKFEWKKNKE